MWRRYALDVNVERAQDVLMHKRLLQLATDPASRPAFDVRIVQVSGHSLLNNRCFQIQPSDDSTDRFHHLM